jgi:glycerophosphoryl diester phosphodiesterase
MSAPLIAHACFDNNYPENTIIGVLGAKKYGFKIVECDLQVTSDNRFVLMHDSTVDRTTDGTGTVSAMTLDQIKALNIDLFPAAFTPKSNIKVPTIEEFFQACKVCNLIPMFETRNFTDTQLTSLFSIITDYGLEEICFVESFYQSDINKLRSLSQKLKLTYLADITDANIAYCKNIGGEIYLSGDYNNMTQALIRQARSNGVKVVCWTLNLVDKAYQFENAGIDYIITNKLLYNNNIQSEVSTQKITAGTLSNGASQTLLNVISSGGAVYGITELLSTIYYTGDALTLDVAGVTYPITTVNNWNIVSFKTMILGGNITITAGAAGTVSWDDSVCRIYKI